MRPTKVEVVWASAHVSREKTLLRGLKPTLPELLSGASELADQATSNLRTACSAIFEHDSLDWLNTRGKPCMKTDVIRILTDTLF